MKSRDIFPDAGALMDPDSNLSDLNYFRAFVSIFDHWLSRSEFEAVFPLDEDQKIDFAKRRLSFFIKLDGLKYQYLEKYILLHQDEYILKIQSLIEGNLGINFYMPEYDLFIEGGYDQTDFFYYKNEDLIKPIINIASESGLFILR